MSRKKMFLIFISLALLAGCGNSTDKGVSKQPDKPKHFDVTIDWVPSPEYYGFFYARDRGFYRDVGLDVKINYGTGAPAVAAEIATGAIYAGTTSSDNVLRQVARSAKFYKVTPILSFNPSVIASLAKAPIGKLAELRGKVLGTNKQSSVYQQLLYLIKIGKLDGRMLKEYPIGYGGAAQLRAGEVDAILAYTTNVVVDLEKENIKVKEIMLAGEGVKTYGLVLVVAAEEQFARLGLTKEDIQKFIAATTKGYKKGAEDMKGAKEVLNRAEPTLDPKKIEIAIEKITRLNKEEGYDLNTLDVWVTDPNVTDSVRKTVIKLYE